MSNQADREVIVDTMGRINRAWLAGRIDDMAPMIHPEVVMTLPGFSGRTQGRDQFLDEFSQFYQAATIHHFHEMDTAVDVVSNTATITLRFDDGVRAKVRTLSIDRA